MKIGIVGLPNVGKSTLFKALTKKQVDIANYPFCTINPNIGVVKVPDERLEKLATFSKSEDILPTSIEFVDIAGLVKGAHKGEGLGNKFLSHIREVDAIAQVVRVFSGTPGNDIVHVDGAVDPVRDIETIHIELIFADLATLEKRIGALRAQLKSKSDKQVELALATCEKLKTALDAGKLAHTLQLDEEERAAIQDLHLLSMKPILYVLNTDESGVIEEHFEESLKKVISKDDAVQLCAQQEAEMIELSPEELKELGLESTGLDRLIKQSYHILSLITYLTTGPKETRAWTVPRGVKAPQAAGVIHTDFEKGFIRAEVIGWKDLLDAGSEVAAKEKGLMRLEGKEYVVQDGDVMVFRFAN